MYKIWSIDGTISNDFIQIVNRAVQLQPSTSAASRKGGRALPKVYIIHISTCCRLEMHITIIIVLLIFRTKILLR